MTRPSAAVLDTDVQFACDAAGLPTASELADWAEAAFVAANVSGVKPAGDAATELCIRVVNAEEGFALNRDYRGRDYATNVLSFPADVPVSEICVLGDIVLCAPVVAQEAQVQSKPLAAHYAHLVVHGVLHLLGLDHEDDAAATVMETQEIAILQQFGVANPYESGSTNHG